MTKDRDGQKTRSWTKFWFNSKNLFLNRSFKFITYYLSTLEIFPLHFGFRTYFYFDGYLFLCHSLNPSPSRVFQISLCTLNIFWSIKWLHNYHSVSNILGSIEVNKRFKKQNVSWADEKIHQSRWPHVDRVKNCALTDNRRCWMRGYKYYNIFKSNHYSHELCGIICLSQDDCGVLI